MMRFHLRIMIQGGDLIAKENLSHVQNLTLPVV